MPQQRADDGYIYPADGSSNDQRYPAPPRPAASSMARSSAINSSSNSRITYYNNNDQAYYQQQPGGYQPRPICPAAARILSGLTIAVLV